MQNEQSNVNKSFIIEKLSKILILCMFNNKNDTDELIVRIIFDEFEKNKKNEKTIKLIEEIIYILFNFDLYSSCHLSKLKNGRFNESSRIIYDYFGKIYDKDSILHLKELIIKRLEPIILISEFKDKLIRVISSYIPPNLIDTTNKINEANNNDSFSIPSFDNEEIEEEDILFKLPNCPLEKRRSLSENQSDNRNKNSDEERDFNDKVAIGRIDLKKKAYDKIKIISDVIKEKKHSKKHSRLYNYDINDLSMKYEGYRIQNSIRPLDDVIIYRGVINAKERKSLKKLFKNKIEKKHTSILIIINDVDKENCTGNCHLCSFIKSLLITIFKREIKYGIYKNYLLHCLTEVFIMNKNLDFKYNFSYYLMKTEGPSRIRKRFNIRLDKLLNNEYDRNAFERRNAKKEDKTNFFDKNNNNVVKDKSIDLDNKEVIENGLEKLFMFYEKKKKYLSENLYIFYNLEQIYNIEILPNLVDSDDKYQYAFNCLLFKGLSYINGVFILGKNKI